MTSNDHLLVLELLGNFLGARAGNVNPGLGEDGAGRDDEDDVKHGVQGVEKGRGNGSRSGNIVGKTGDGLQLARSFFQRLPDTQELDQEVAGVPGKQHLTDEENVAGQGGFKHDRHVGGVEELDRVSASHATVLGALDRNLKTESLEVDDGGKDNGGGQEIHNVGKSVPVESLLESAGLVVPSEKQVEEGNDGSFKLWSSTGVDGTRAESLPNDRLANVGGNEKVDSGTETVALGQELIEEQNNGSGRDELQNQQQDDSGAERSRGTIEAGKNVYGGLSKGNDEGKD